MICVSDAGGRAMASVCDCSLVGIAGSNPAEGMDVVPLWMLCVVQVEASAMGRSIVQGSQTEVTLRTYIELL